MKPRFVLVAVALIAAGSAHAPANVLKGSDTTSEAGLSRGSHVAVLDLAGMRTAADPRSEARAATTNDPRDDADAEAGPLTYGLMALGLIGMSLVAHRRNA